MEKIIHSYYRNNAFKLHKLVDKILYKLRFFNIDKDDFYSLANELFIYAIEDYDKDKSCFESFLEGRLTRKFCTFMRDDNRDKRKNTYKKKIKQEDGTFIEQKVIVYDRSIYEELEEGCLLLEIIEDKKNSIEKEMLDKDESEEKWCKEVKQYLDSLSPLQRKIALRLSERATPSEICEELNITMCHYTNSVNRIFADEKTKILKPLVEKGK